MQEGNNREQVCQEPVPQAEVANAIVKFTRLELCQTIGELIKLGYIRPVLGPEYVAGADVRAVTRYPLTEERP